MIRLGMKFNTKTLKPSNPKLWVSLSCDKYKDSDLEGNFSLLGRGVYKREIGIHLCLFIGFYFGINLYSPRLYKMLDSISDYEYENDL